MTSSALKILAILAMTVDHAAAVLGQSGIMAILNLTELTPENLTLSANILHIMRGIGRLAFPLFAFMIAEGCKRTRSMPKYIGRLLLFAAISEPFFYFALSLQTPTLAGFFQDLISLNFSNVFFTLSLGAAAIYACQLLSRRGWRHAQLLYLPVILAAALIGGYIGCDYGMAGVVLIAFLYLAKTKTQTCIVILVWTACLYGFGQAFNPIGTIVLHCFFCALSCVFILLYNGKRGRAMKWSFYIYYPAHLLVLSLLSALIR